MARYYDTQLVNVVWQYSKLLNARVTKTTLQNDLQENPYYPTLLSISRTFSKNNIPNNAYKISSQQFNSFDPPFIALQKIPGKDNDFVLVTEMDENEITYVYEKDKHIKLKRDDFLKEFQGIVWLAIPGEESGEQDYSLKVKEEKNRYYKKSGLAVCLLFILAALVYANFASAWLLPFVSIFLLKLVGCTIAGLLLLYEIDRNNAILKNICTNDSGKQSGCDAVLNSKASKVFGIHLGELVFFYFSGTMLLLLLPVLTFQDKIAWLAIFNICALPFLFFSIFYQWRVVKKWCKLCLATSAIVILEFIGFIFFFWNRYYLPETTNPGLCYTASVFLLPVVAWFSVKPILAKAKGFNLYYLSYLRLKNRPDIFGVELKKEAPIVQGSDNLGLTIGNPEGSIEIVEVSSPFCMPCSYAHEKIAEWIQRNRKLKVQVLFMNQNSKSDAGAIIVKHLLAIKEKSNDIDILQALSDWHSNKSYSEFARKYPMTEAEIERQGSKLDEMFEWCVASRIQFTPTYFINGFQLPDSYNLDDLINIL